MEVSRVLLEEGILVVIAGFYIYEKFRDSRTITNLLRELNTSLKIVQTSVLTTQIALDRHDERLNAISTEIIAISLELKKIGKVGRQSVKYVK